MKFNLSKKFILAIGFSIALASCSNTDTATTTDTAKAEVSADQTDADQKNEVSTSQSETTDSNDKDDTQTIDVKTPDKKENSENKEAKAEEKSQGVDNMTYEERDGLYFSTLMASKSGNRDSEMGIPFVSNVKIDGETITIEGSLDYIVNPEDIDAAAEEYENGTYNFKLSPDVTFQAVGGLAEPEYFEKDEFIKFYEEVKESGLGLRLDVENGIVTVVSVAS